MSFGIVLLTNGIDLPEGISKLNSSERNSTEIEYNKFLFQIRHINTAAFQETMNPKLSMFISHVDHTQ